MRTFSWVFLSIVFLLSCSKSEHDIDLGLSLVHDEISSQVYQFIKHLGYQEDEIQDVGDVFVVDGDILFAKDVLPQSTLSDEPKTKQYGTNYYIGYNRQPNITVRIDPSLSSIQGDIVDALAIWNNVPNVRLQFNLVTHTNQDILITNQNLGWGICGMAFFPVNGRAGSQVRINLSFITSIGMSSAQRRALTAHELGHAIGFRHTDWQGSEALKGTLNGAHYSAQHILGTPTGNDPNSLMNAGTCNSSPTTLSNFDIVAFQFLYPANPPEVGTVPVFRYFRRGSKSKDHNHFFTTDINELGDGNSNYTFEGIGFFAYPNALVPGTVPIFRYRRTSDYNHFYTRTAGSYNKYILETIAFYAYPSALNGSLPVHRYYSSSNLDHHYTLNPNESNMTGYVWEGVEFFAY